MDSPLTHNLDRVERSIAVLRRVLPQVPPHVNVWVDMRFPTLRLRGSGRLHSRRQQATVGRIFRTSGLPAPHSYRQGCTYRAGEARPQARRMTPRERVSGMVSATRGLLSIYFFKPGQTLGHLPQITGFISPTKSQGSVQPQIRSPKDLISNPFAGVRSCTGPGLSGGLPWGGVRTRTPKDLISNPEFRGIRGSGHSPGFFR